MGLGLEQPSCQALWKSHPVFVKQAQDPVLCSEHLDQILTAQDFQ
jgi:hypothetical protein